MSNSAGKIEITENTLLKLLIRRGSNVERQNITLSEGELGYTVDTRRLFVGDGVTTGANPTSLMLYFGTYHPYTWASEAVVGDVAYDAIAGGIYRLTAAPPNVQSNWTLYSGPLANRVDNETLQLNASTGTMSVKAVSALQLDPELAGQGLEFNGTRALQTAADQQLDSIAARNNAYLQLPKSIQFGTQGGSSVFKLPSYDGAFGSVLTTDGLGNLTLASPSTYQTQYIVLSSNQVPVGSIVPFGSGGNFNAISSTVPHGYFLCDGSTKNGTTYAALCAAIGQYYGGVAPNFKVPLLTAGNFVYIIKHLEDQIFGISNVAIDNVSLTAYDATNASSTATLVFPNSGISYQLGIKDYIGGTQVQAQIAALSALLLRDPKYAGRIIIPTLNTGTTMVCVDHGFLLDAAGNIRAAGYSGGPAGTPPYGSSIGYGNITTNVSLFFPVAIGLSANEVAISAYSIGDFSAILTSEGNIFTAGNSANGTLGLGGTTVQNTFAQINPSYFNYEKVTQIAGSYTNGADRYPEVGMFAITESGNLYGWGRNDSGVLGIGTTTASQTTPIKINGTAYMQGSNYSSLSNVQVKKVTTSNNGANQFAFVIDENDELHSCGNNQNGNLGLTNSTNRTIFYKVSANIGSLSVRDVFVGGYSTNSNSYIITGDERYLWSTGSYESGALGRGSVAVNQTTFKPVSSVSGSLQLSGVSYLALNADSTNLISVMALLQDNSLVGWGENGSYQLGTINNIDSNIPIRPLAPFTGIKKIQYHSDTLFMLTTAGEMYTVGGANGDGIAGNGTTTAATTKKRVAKIQRVKFDDFVVVGFTSASSPYYYRTVYAITDDPVRRVFYTWGRNNAGQCGVTTTMNPILIPIEIPL
jgi:hypothetical protein